MCTYVNPFTDSGFKPIFGQENSKPFLIDFLNDLLANEKGFESIVSVEYRDKERPRRRKEERGVIYDIYCTTQDGKQFEEKHAYDEDLKAYRDIRNQMEYAKETGLAEGRAVGMAQGRKEGMAQGMAKGMAKVALISFCRLSGFPLPFCFFR